MAKGTIAPPENPLIEQNPDGTTEQALAVLSYLELTAPDLVENGSNPQANHGLAVILRLVIEALEHAQAQRAAA